MGRTDEFKTGLRHAGNAPAANLKSMNIGQLFAERSRPGATLEERLAAKKELFSRADGGY